MNVLSVWSGQQKDQELPVVAGVTHVLWLGGVEEERPDCISLAERLAADGEPLRAEFVEWRDGLSKLIVGRRSLASALDLAVPGGGALWWASTVAATPVESLPRVADVLKLRLLERIAEAGSYERVEYNGTDSELGDVLGRWCAAANLSFRRMSPRGESEEDRTDRSSLRRLPHPVEALRYLVSFCRRRLRPSRVGRRQIANADARDLAIVTYFPHIDREEAANGRFRSQYWRPLYRLIEESGLRVHWIWLVSETDQWRLTDAVTFRDRLNSTTEADGQSYALVEDQMRWRDLISACQLYLQLVWLGVLFRSITARFRFAGSRIDFFPLLAEEWRSSTRWRHAMFIALHAVAWRTAVRHTPPVRRLLYLWENQSWEYLLLDAWKVDRTAPALGVAHTPMCSSPGLIRNRHSRSRQTTLQALGPDRVITTGPVATRTLQRLGWPAGVVEDAEALRYEHLDTARRRTTRPLPRSGRRLLVLTGISAAEAAGQLELLRAVEKAGGLAAYEAVYVKGHPFRPVEGLVSRIPFDRPPEIVSGTVEDLLDQADVVFCSGDTSVSVDAACRKLPVAVHASLTGWTLSPLQGVPGVAFVATVRQLLSQLRDPICAQIDSDYFTLDRTLPKWSSLLAGDRLRPTPESFDACTS